MIPHMVCFDGYEFDPRAVLDARKVTGLIPNEWVRVRFDVATVSGMGKRLNDWLAGMVTARWASYSVDVFYNRRVVVVAFESETDAVMFKLHGETAWLGDVQESA